METGACTASATVNSSVAAISTTVATIWPVTPTTASMAHHRAHRPAAPTSAVVRRIPDTLRTSGAESTTMRTALAVSSTAVSQAGAPVVRTTVGSASANIMLVPAKTVLTPMRPR